MFPSLPGESAAPGQCLPQVKQVAAVDWTGGEETAYKGGPIQGLELYVLLRSVWSLMPGLE